MQREQILARIDEVVARGEATVSSAPPVQPSRDPRLSPIDPDHRWVQGDIAAGFRFSGLRLLEDLYGTDHQTYRDFGEATKDARIVGYYRVALGLIKAVRAEFSGGSVVGAPNREGSPKKDSVFLVHGHDEGAREQVARFLEQLGIRPVILHEQANKGRTIIEKLERSGDIAFAVVVLTPDDVGASAKTADRQMARARQNVILELGYFIGLLGRERVCALHKGELELPSDFVGVAYVPLDPAGGWRLSLARELKAARYDVDLNKAV